MTIPRIKELWSFNQKVTSAQFNLMDIRGTWSADKRSGQTDTIAANWTVTGNQTHNNNTITLNGTGPGASYFTLNNVNASAINGALIRVTSPVAHNASPMQLAVGSNLSLTNSYMTVDDGYIRVGANSQLRLPNARIYFNPTTTKTIHHSAVDNVNYFAPALWNAGSYTEPAWDCSVNYWMEASSTYRAGSFVVGLPELRNVVGTIDSLTVHYKVAGASRTPSGARMVVQLGSYSGTSMSGATFLTQQLPYSSYGADISHTFTGLNIALVGDRSWRIRVDNEHGTGAVGGNIIYGYTIGLTNVSSLYI